MRYLGQTSKDPFTYKGSGTYWKRHIKKHGYDVSTVILAECNSIQEVRDLGMKYSNKWDVANSGEFANLKPETGESSYGWSPTEETRQNMAAAAKGNKRRLGMKPSEETRRKLSEAKKGENNPFYGKKHSEEARRKIAEANKGQKYRLGMKHSEETKRKLSESRKLYLEKKRQCT